MLRQGIPAPCNFETSLDRPNLIPEVLRSNLSAAYVTGSFFSDIAVSYLITRIAQYIAVLYLIPLFLPISSPRLFPCEALKCDKSTRTLEELVESLE